MNLWRKLRLRIRALFRKQRLDTDMDEELRSHIEMRTQENLEAGMEPEEARFAAQRQFGWMETIKETSREQRGVSWIENLLRDVRFGLRMLRKNPGFTIIAILTLTLGIGANTAIFSVLQTLMFQALPFPGQDRLVQVFRTSPESRHWPHSVADFLDQQRQNTVIKPLGAFVQRHFSLAEPGAPAENLRGIAATSEIFSALATPPLLGRVFTPEEDQPGRDHVVVLNHGFWARRFASDTNIVGRRVRMDGENVTVIGVMPPTFDYPQLWGPIDAWRPLAFTQAERQDRRDHWLEVLGRLKPGVTISQADAAMRAFAARQEQAYPESNARQSSRVAPLRESIGDTASRRFAWLMLGLTGFVLLIACVNLANLQLARASTRTREFAVRLALGSGAVRLMRQLFCESAILALAGGACGILLSIWLGKAIGAHINHPYFPNGFAVEFDWNVLLFALLCTVVTALLFGLAPAWLASRANLNSALSSGTRGTTSRPQMRLQHALIVGQFALALILLTGTGLFVTGLKRFIQQDPGWRVDGLLTAWFPMTSGKYATADQRRSFIERLEERLSALPGVRNAAISSSLPIWSFGSSTRFVVEGESAPPIGQEPLVQTEAVTPGYFETLGVRLREGRTFTASDTTNHPDLIVINEAMARRFWPGQSAIGKRIGNNDPVDPDWQEVIGVVNDIRFAANLGTQDTPWQMYRAFAQQPRSFGVIELRTTSAPESVAAALRNAVAELDSDLPLSEVESARTRVNRLLSHFAISSAFLSTFAALALLLAALGIYGVISYFVVQRTGEIGIRRALGAQTARIIWLVLGKGLVLSLLGVVFGLGGALLIARLLSAAVPELPIGNSGAFVAAVTLFLITVTLLACWLPARQAAKINPMIALRYE